MGFEERVYTALVVSDSEKFNRSIEPLLKSAGCGTIAFVGSITAAKRRILENSYDFVVINAPARDDTGTKLAIDVSSSKGTVCLMLIRAELYDDIHLKATPYGVFTLSKPTSTAAVAAGLEFMAAARERLRRLEKRATTIEEKMEEIRLVNRAKWLLIDNLKMSEPDAHRYIEKQAMNACVTKNEIAREIIKTYT